MGGGSSGIPIVGGLVESASNIAKGNATTEDWIRVGSTGIGSSSAGGGGVVTGAVVGDTADLYIGMTDAEKAAKAQAKKNAETQAQLEREAVAQAENQDAQDKQIQERDAARRRQRSSAGAGGRQSTLLTSPLSMLGSGASFQNGKNLLGA